MPKETKAFYHTMAWKNTRKAYSQSVGGLCERCYSKGIVTPAEIVHHKIPLTEDNISDTNITLNWNNLEALCRKCHAEVHEQMYQDRSNKRYTIDSNGKVIIREDRE
jgi:5-methylcytosine-specific restriction endonuclease McrA